MTKNLLPVDGDRVLHATRGMGTVVQADRSNLTRCAVRWDRQAVRRGDQMSIVDRRNLDIVHDKPADMPQIVTEMGVERSNKRSTHTFTGTDPAPPQIVTGRPKP